MNITLLILLFICHWAADYTHLSRPYMLQAKRFGKPLMPIFLHASVHAILMSIVCCIYFDRNPFTFKPDIIDLVFAIQLVSHFLIDVLKGKMNVWFPSLANPSNPYHWYVFGGDQLLHTLAIIIIWYVTL